MEGDREGLQVEAPAGHRLLWDRAMEAVLHFLENTWVECMATLRRPPEEEWGEDSENEEDGPDPPL